MKSFRSTPSVSICKKLNKKDFSNISAVWLKREKDRKWAVWAYGVQDSYADVLEWYPCPTVEELFAAMERRGWDGFVELGSSKYIADHALFAAQINITDKPRFYYADGSSPVEALCKCYIKAVRGERNEKTCND